MNDQHHAVDRFVVLSFGLAFVVGACSGASATAPPTTAPTAVTTTAPTATPTSGTTSEATTAPTEPTDAPVETVEYLTNTTMFTPFVAQTEGLYEGVNVNVTRVGFGEQNSLFATGNYPITSMAPWEVAHANNQGDDLRFVSTASGILAYNPVIIRRSDETTYTVIQDLEGQKLGIPGFGTGAWTAFATTVKQLYDIDARTYFDAIEADTGALLALLERGEIEAALPFSGTALIADANPDKFATLLSLYDFWQEQTGHPLLITGLTARSEWLDENPDQVQAIIAGFDAAVPWMADNADALLEPPYLEWMEGAGVTADSEQTERFLDLVRDQNYFTTSEAYTQDWIDNQYSFIENGVGVLVDEVPPQDTIFYAP